MLAPAAVARQAAPEQSSLRVQGSVVDSAQLDASQSHASPPRAAVVHSKVQSAALTQAPASAHVPAAMACAKSRQTSSLGQVTSGHSEAKAGRAPHEPSLEQRSQATSPQARSQQRRASSTSGAQTPDAHSASSAQSWPSEASGAQSVHASGLERGRPPVPRGTSASCSGTPPPSVPGLRLTGGEPPSPGLPAVSLPPLPEMNWRSLELHADRLAPSSSAAMTVPGAGRIERVLERRDGGDRRAEDRPESILCIVINPKAA